MDSELHEYTHALVGRLKQDVDNLDPVKYEERRCQYDSFLRLLRELELEVVDLDICNSFPENIIIEDLVITVPGIALITKSATTTEATIQAIRNNLQQNLGYSIVEVSNPEVKLLGSDVLFTGKEFFVGISDSTNEAGASAVAEAFPEFPCTPIKVPSGSSYLKHYVTVAGSEILCVGSSSTAKDLLKRMEREATFTYQTLTVPEDIAANCLYLNGTLIHRAIEEIPASFKVFCEKIDFARRSICFSEIPVGLTSCCLLLRNSVI